MKETLPEGVNLKVYNSRGPKPTLVNRRQINVSLTDELIEKAQKIGRGNASRGIRLALEAME